MTTSSNLAEVAQGQKLDKRSGSHYSLVHTGPLEELLKYDLKHPLREKAVRGKIFLKDHLELTGMQVSINLLPAGIQVPFFHKHRRNEELYIFIKGSGQIQIDEDIHDVREGTCVRIATGGDRTWRNNSTEDLYYIVIQARENSLESDTFEDGLPSKREIHW